ncbi:MAG: M28 family peptidase [Pseudomonadota bacterium]
MFKCNRGVATALLSIAAFSLPAPAFAHPTGWVVRPEWVKAHEDFLASPALQGRGSATRDEAIAAAYVAAQFERLGLKTAPGMDGYTQVARLVRPRLTGSPALTVAGSPLNSLTFMFGADYASPGYAVMRSADPKDMPTSDVVVVTDPTVPLRAVLGAAEAKHVRLVILPASDATKQVFASIGGKPRLRAYLEGNSPPPSPGLATLSREDIAILAAKGSAPLKLSVPVALDVAETTNAIGYLPGSDPKAGNLLISAHLDHLGVVNGMIMPGANDDASGTAAVIELAHALASGKPTKRGILFVCYGSEEMGGFGSRYFGEHPPVPLTSVVANLELEMIGSQDPKLPKGHLMMTGFERSNFGEILKKNGALVAKDPYSEENFFRRSDNYSLALKGIVAHTVSGWAVVPTYHKPTDTIANLNIDFMAKAIQSLIAPLRSIANGGETPKWRPNGRPSED